MGAFGTVGSRLVAVWNGRRRFADAYPGFAAILVVAACLVGWMVDIVVAPAVIGLATHDWPYERLYDPSLGNHMGFDAIRFDVQVALVLVFLAPWVVVGVFQATKTRTLGAAIVPAAVPAIVSTWLFFATGTSTCELGELGETDLIVVVSLGLAALLAFAGGAIAGRRERRPVVAIAMLVASSLTIVSHVQWENCAGFSQQISRELNAVLMFGFLLAATAGIASLGRVTAGLVRTRWQQTGAPI